MSIGLSIEYSDECCPDATQNCERPLTGHCGSNRERVVSPTPIRPRYRIDLLESCPRVSNANAASTKTIPAYAPIIVRSMIFESGLGT